MRLINLSGFLIFAVVVVAVVETDSAVKRQAEWWEDSDDSGDFEDYMAWKQRRREFLRRKQFKSSRWRDFHYHHHDAPRYYSQSTPYGYGYPSYGSGYYPSYGYGGGYGYGGQYFNMGIGSGLGIGTPIGGFGISSGFGISVG